MGDIGIDMLINSATFGVKKKSQYFDGKLTLFAAREMSGSAKAPCGLRPSRRHPRFFVLPFWKWVLATNSAQKAAENVFCLWLSLLHLPGLQPAAAAAVAFSTRALQISLFQSLFSEH